jgi:predicted Zn-dependent protease
VSRVVLQRAAVVIVALLAVAWLAVRYSDARKLQSVQKTLEEPGGDRAQLESAIARARSAGRLDPGTGAEELSYVAALQIKMHDPQAALATLEDLVRREPDTAEPYLLITELTRTSDPARSAQALAQLRRLDPGVPSRKTH